MKKITVSVLLFIIVAVGILFIFKQNSTKSEGVTEQYTNILLVGVNDYQPDTLALLQENLQQSFPGVGVIISEQVLTIPNELINKERGQYDSAEVLNFIQQSFPNRPSTQMIIGVTGDDIYSGNLNFVFSGGDQANKVGVVSTAYFGREIQVPSDLDSDFDFTEHAKKTINDRTYKTTLRMIGGMAGLSSNLLGGSDCVMRFSNTIAELDEKGLEWCGDDHKQLEAVGLLN